MKSFSAKKIGRGSELLEPSRMISLNLSDLKTLDSDDDGGRSPQNDLLEMSLPIFSNPEEYVAMQLHEVGQYEEHYQHSLEILFQKAQGTSYESVIKKLYQDRQTSDFQLDDKQESFHIPSNQFLNSESQKIPNLNLQLRQRSRASTPTPEEQQKVDLILSKPLPRNMWQVRPSSSSPLSLSVCFLCDLDRAHPREDVFPPIPKGDRGLRQRTHIVQN